MLFPKIPFHGRRQKCVDLQMSMANFLAWFVMSSSIPEFLRLQVEKGRFCLRAESAERSRTRAIIASSKRITDAQYSK